MARVPRIKSETGFYHLIMRGTGQQIIFESDSDRAYFLKKASEKKEGTNVEIHAYCLMDNHFHLLICDPNDEMEHFVRRLATSYAMHFNHAYGHTGHVFQDRYKSEPVLDDKHYMTVLRYIIQNPIKAGLGISKLAEWTSFSGYFEKNTTAAGIITSNMASDIAGGKAALRSFLLRENEDVCLDVFQKQRISDKELREIICGCAGVESPLLVKSLSKGERDNVIGALLDMGISARRLERETGISVCLICKIRDAKRLDYG